MHALIPNTNKHNVMLYGYLLPFALLLFSFSLFWLLANKTAYIDLSIYVEQWNTIEEKKIKLQTIMAMKKFIRLYPDSVSVTRGKKANFIYMLAHLMVKSIHFLFKHTAADTFGKQRSGFCSMLSTSLHHRLRVSSGSTSKHVYIAPATLTLTSYRG